MALNEGMRRTNKLGRVMLVTGAISMLCALIVALASSRAAMLVNMMPLVGLFLGIGYWLTAGGGLVLVIWYLADGFAEKEQPD